MHINRRTQTNTSISSNTLFTLLSVIFSPTYSFNVLVEATVDAASSHILLNLQSSALAATHPFGSQPLFVAVVEYYLHEKPIDSGLIKFLGLCPSALSWYLEFALHSPPPWPLLRPILSLHESKGSMTPRKSHLCGTKVLPSP
ncbi:hypothetical protein BHM03_00059243 [Ensete ventricosum]|nr:hypothetical protein BHM03_00059243 [Ensete ventricosum]